MHTHLVNMKDSNTETVNARPKVLGRMKLKSKLNLQTFSTWGLFSLTLTLYYHTQRCFYSWVRLIEAKEIIITCLLPHQLLGDN